jgi:hypothetical protein
MTPRQNAIRIIKQSFGDDLERARLAFAGLTPEKMDEQYGQSGQTRRQIIEGYEQSRHEHQAALDWVESHEEG